MIPIIEPVYGPEERKAVIKYLESGSWLTEHDKAREFEAALAVIVGAKHCVVLSSGTTALLSALLALDIGAGDEVIVPDYTFIATAMAVSLTGAKPIFVDVSEETACLDLDSARQAITGKTQAIIVVSISGRAPDMALAKQIANEYNVYLLEDAAQALGSRQNGGFLGSFGHVGVYSFQAMKIVSMGQGGAIVTDDDQLATKIRMIKNFGRPSPGANRHEIMGSNFKITDLQAVIGIEQLKKLQYRISVKKNLWRLYKDGLDGLPIIFPTITQNTVPWVVDVLVESPVGLRDHLLHRGIMTRLAYPSCHSQSAYAPPANHDFYCPNSMRVAKHGLWLPSSVNLSAHDVEWICNEVRTFFRI